MSALLIRASEPTDQVAIAVPNHSTYTTLLDTLKEQLTTLGVGVYVIAEDRSVEVMIPPGSQQSAG
jgi:hypothetical protein